MKQFFKNLLPKQLKEDKNTMLARQHKEYGNEALQQGMLEEAIMHYTKSLNYDETNAVVFTNRATAFKRHRDFKMMLEDSEVAINLNREYFKAQLRHGEACVELGKVIEVQDCGLIDQGITSLEKSLWLCKKLGEEDRHFESKKQFMEEIKCQIRRAKKIRWYKDQQIKREQKDLLLAQLRVIAEGQGEDHKIVSEKVALFLESQDVKMEEPPDYLMCRIIDDFMIDPVVIESGFTYEREFIQQHFRKNGAFDPLTREDVNPGLLIQNKQLKQAINDYLDLNPWAYEHLPGEKLESLKM